MKKYILLNASSISIITGHNKYQKFSDFLLDLWIKYDNNDYIDVINNNKHLKYEIKLKDKEVIEKFCTKEVKNTIKKSLFSNNVDNINQNKKKLIKKIDENKDYDENTKKSIKESINNMMNTQYGINNEKKAIHNFKKNNNIEIFHTNEYRKRKINNQLFIGGKIDGYTENGSIVEVKNRMNRLFNHIVGYEKVQLQCYLYIFQKDKGYLVEKYKDTMNVIEEDFDEKYFDGIIKILENFQCFFNDFMENIDLKTLLLFGEKELIEETLNILKKKYNF